MNTAIVVIIAIICTICITKIASILMANKSSSNYVDKIVDDLDEIRPIIDDLILELIRFNDSKGSFEETLSYSSRFVKSKIDKATFLLPEEKELLSKELIRSIIESPLRKLYNTPNVYTLEQARSIMFSDK